MVTIKVCTFVVKSQTEVFNDMQETYIYELVDITFEIPYALIEEEGDFFAREDEPIQPEEKPAILIEYDADGIPMGNTKEAFRARQDIISRFWHQLKEKYQTPEDFKIHNHYLNEDIYLRAISLIEAREHSAKTNLSTRAFLFLEEVLANARPVGRVRVKENDSNQNAFQQMLIMTYHCDGVGRVKLTIGIKKKKDNQEQKIEYSLTHLPDGSPLIPPQPKKKASRK